MSVNRIICLLGLLAVVAFFSWGVPLGTYYHYPVFFSFTGGLLIALIVAQALGEYTSVYDLSENFTTVSEGSPQRSMVPLAFMPGILLGLIFYSVNEHHVTNALQTEGNVIKATITNGVETKTTTTRRGTKNTSTKYEISYAFKDEQKKTYYGLKEVTLSQIRNAYKGQKIDIVYWKKDPNVANVLLTDEELIAYKHIPDKNLSYKHILVLLDHKLANDSIVSYLNSINYEWINTKNYYVNERLQVAMEIKSENEILMLETIDLLKTAGNKYRTKFQKQLFSEIKKAGFTIVSEAKEGSATTIYEKDSYTITVTTKLTGEASSIDMINVYHFIKHTN